MPEPTLRFSVERGSYIGTSDTAFLDNDEPADALAQGVMHALEVDIAVTVSGVTMILAAWRDPEHWSDDWKTELGCDHDEVPERVAELLAEAIE